MEKKEIQRIIFVFALFLMIAFALDIFGNQNQEAGVIVRENLGGGKKEEVRVLEIGTGEKMEFVMEISPVLPTAEEAEVYFQEAIKEIDADFCEISEVLPLNKKYLDGKVKAQWNLSPWKIADSEGNIDWEAAEELSDPVEAEVRLSCGNYEHIYRFSFAIPKPEADSKEAILLRLKSWIRSEMQKEGETEIRLPTELEGMNLKWTVEKDTLTPKILLLEGLAAIGLVIGRIFQKKEEKEKRNRELEWEYPKIVSELTLLLGAGMNLRQAWEQLAQRYHRKCEEGVSEGKEAYEGLVRMLRRISEGEMEENAYFQYGEEMSHPFYRRLMRILSGHLEKGNRSLTEALEEESKKAFEIRVTNARKRGEEASTRLLLPLMLLLSVVLLIVLAPAMIDFMG